MTFAPFFQHLQASATGNADALLDGLPILPNCVLINPDGTGFGGGGLDIELTYRKEGDSLWLRATSDISIESQHVFFQGKHIGSMLDLNKHPSVFSIRFTPHVYFEMVSALLACIELRNPKGVPGDREITVHAIDAEGEAASANLSIKLYMSKDNSNSIARLEYLRRNGRFWEAASVAEQSIVDYTKNWKATYTQALILAEIGEIDAALLLLNRALETGADPALIYCERGRMEWLRGNIGSAIDDLLTSYSLDPQIERPLNLLIESILPTFG